MAPGCFTMMTQQSHEAFEASSSAAAASASPSSSPDFYYKPTVAVGTSSAPLTTSAHSETSNPHLFASTNQNVSYAEINLDQIPLPSTPPPPRFEYGSSAVRKPVLVVAPLRFKSMDTIDSFEVLEQTILKQKRLARLKNTDLRTKVLLKRTFNLVCEIMDRENGFENENDNDDILRHDEDDEDDYKEYKEADDDDDEPEDEASDDSDDSDEEYDRELNKCLKQFEIDQILPKDENTSNSRHESDKLGKSDTSALLTSAQVPKLESKRKFETKTTGSKLNRVKRRRASEEDSDSDSDDDCEDDKDQQLASNQSLLPSIDSSVSNLYLFHNLTKTTSAVKRPSSSSETSSNKRPRNTEESTSFTIVS